MQNKKTVLSKQNGADVPSGKNVQALLFRLLSGSFADAADLLERCGISVCHLEVRPRPHDQGNDFLVITAAQPSTAALAALRSSVQELSQVPTPSGLSRPTPWFPRRFADLDKICSQLVDIESDMKTIPPGWDDPAYMARRREIEALARKYCCGQPLPHVEYRQEELITWKRVFERQTALYSSHACREYNAGLKLLIDSGAYSADSIPQLAKVSAVLEAATGSTLRPVAGFLSPRHFLNCLAFRVFNTTQYIRHHDHPFYTPEPDVLHDLLGHAPLFADKDFAEFSQQLGLASLGASDEDIERLSNVYWYTLEFGNCLEDGERRAYGAGLLSSIDELPRCLKEDVETRPFDTKEAAVEPYIFNGFQHCYFVAKSFKSATEDFKTFAEVSYVWFKLLYEIYRYTIIHVYLTHRLSWPSEHALTEDNSKAKSRQKEG